VAKETESELKGAIPPARFWFRLDILTMSAVFLRTVALGSLLYSCQRRLSSMIRVPGSNANLHVRMIMSLVVTHTSAMSVIRFPGYVLLTASHLVLWTDYLSRLSEVISRPTLRQ